MCKRTNGAPSSELCAQRVLERAHSLGAGGKSVSTSPYPTLPASTRFGRSSNLRITHLFEGHNNYAALRPVAIALLGESQTFGTNGQLLYCSYCCFGVIVVRASQMTAGNLINRNGISHGVRGSGGFPVRGCVAGIERLDRFVGLPISCCRPQVERQMWKLLLS